MEEERAALRRLGQTLRLRLRLVHPVEEGGPAWTGQTLSRVKNMRRRREDKHKTMGGDSGSGG